MQVSLFLFAVWVLRDLHAKATELRQKHNIEMVREQTLTLSGIPNISQTDLEKHLRERWSQLGCREPLYVNFVFDISSIKSKMDRIIELAQYRLQILKWRDSLKMYNFSNEYFASSGFTPKVLPFQLSHFQQMAHPYPKISTPNSIFEKELNLMAVNKLLRRKQEELHATIKRNPHFSGTAFVVFRSRTEAETVFNYESNLFRRIYYFFSCNPMNRISTAMAENPNDILWEHAGSGGWIQFGRQICTVLVAFVFLFLNFMAQIFINSEKNNRLSQVSLLKQAGTPITNEMYYGLQTLSLLVALSIVLTNEVGRVTLSFLVEEERHITLSSLQTSKVIVITTFKFFNTAVVTWVASFFSLGNFSDQFRAGGMIDDISAALIYYAVLHQLWYVIDPVSILKACLKSACLFKVTHQDGNVYLPKYTQLQAEQLYEGPEFDVTFHIHDTLFVFWVAMFYLPMLPTGAIAALLAFLSNVAYVKVRLLTRHKRPEHCDLQLWDTLARLLPWMIYTSSIMQLLYVRWSFWYMTTLQKEKSI